MPKKRKRGARLASPIDLTEDDREREKRWNTYAGMASWGTEGPQGTTCKDCVFFVPDPSRGFSANGFCRKFQELMGSDQSVLKFPSWARSCKYFAAK